MHVIDDIDDQGVRRVTLSIPAAEPVPAVAWLPARPPKATVLLGHGGAMHKTAPAVVRLAHHVTKQAGYAVVAIDAPLHGARIPVAERGMTPLERRAHMGLSAWRARNAAATGQAVADWRATLDAVRRWEAIGETPVGYLGLSMGTRFGIPFVAAEPRVTAAVFGLFGHSPESGEPAFGDAARSLSVPVLFLLQWDDELMPRADGLALFDLIGTSDKTMHANPGGHLGMPKAEAGAAVAFLAQRLSRAADGWMDDQPSSRQTQKG